MNTVQRSACGSLMLVALLAAAPSAQASGGAPSLPSLSQMDVGPELAEAQHLIDNKDWPGALNVLKKALRKDSKNADVHNLMGYSYRKSGQLDAAFDSYHKALKIDPKHRGANEYIGEAYLMVNQPEKAREHLAALKSICGESCEEYQDLAKALADWKPPATAK